MKFKIKKLRENVILPNRAHKIDAGLDVFWSPDPDFDTKKKTYHKTYICRHPITHSIFAIIHPNENLLLGTGISVEFPSGYAMEVKNRSSMASKNQLVVGACLIDSGYRGEIFIDLHNIGKYSYRITEGDKIAQLVIYPIETPEYEIVENLDETDRGSGGFGSTDL